MLKLLNRRFFFTAFAALFFLGGSLMPGQPVYGSGPIKVVVTTGIIGDLTAEIGGERVEVQTLMGPGIDPHAYRQTRSDIVALGKADLVLWNGLYLEAQMEDLLIRLSEDKPIVALAENIPEELLISSEDYEGRYDPHLWMNPALWSQVVINARDALILIDPLGEPAYVANTQSYLEKLDQLSRYTSDILASVPADSRVLLTAHDAFNYFGEAYGFEVIGIQGISTESEAGLLRIAELVDLLVERDVGAVFVESSVSDRNIKALIEGAAAQSHEVVIGGELFSDAMGEPGTYRGTYIGMIDHNATTISAALGGNAPQLGMQGLLN